MLQEKKYLVLLCLTFVLDVGPSKNKKFLPPVIYILRPVQKFATGMLEKISIFWLSLSRGMLTMQLLVQFMGQSWGLIYYRYFVAPEK